MARQKPKYGEDILKSVLESTNEIYDHKKWVERLPPYKITRDSGLQLERAEKDLFTELEEKESGGVIVSGLSKISEQDFTAFSFALGQVLYNQSYIFKNTDINSGICREIADGTTEKIGVKLYSGRVVVTLNDLVRLAYGVEEPETNLKNKMLSVIETIDKTPVIIKHKDQFGEWVEDKEWLCRRMRERTREKDGAKAFELCLNPIFSSNIQNQFGELPQDITKRLSSSTKRKTPQHYILLRWLAIQDKRMAHKLSIAELVKLLRLEDYFRKDKGKAEKQIISLCETMQKIGILSSFIAETKTKGTKKSIVSITFNLNKNFIRKQKQK